MELGRDEAVLAKSHQTSFCCGRGRTEELQAIFIGASAFRRELLRQSLLSLLSLVQLQRSRGDGKANVGPKFVEFSTEPHSELIQARTFR